MMAKIATIATELHLLILIKLSYVFFCAVISMFILVIDRVQGD